MVGWCGQARASRAEGRGRTKSEGVKKPPTKALLLVASAGSSWAISCDGRRGRGECGGEGGGGEGGGGLVEAREAAARMLASRWWRWWRCWRGGAREGGNRRQSSREERSRECGQGGLRADGVPLETAFEVQLGHLRGVRKLLWVLSARDNGRESGRESARVRGRVRLTSYTWRMPRSSRLKSKP